MITSMAWGEGNKSFIYNTMRAGGVGSEPESALGGLAQSKANQGRAVTQGGSGSVARWSSLTKQGKTKTQC